MRFEYAPGATPIGPDEAKELIPAHITLQRELNEYEESNILEATAWFGIPYRHFRQQNQGEADRGSPMLTYSIYRP